MCYVFPVLWMTSYFSPLGKLADRAMYFACVNLARSAKVAERAICFTDRNFFLFFFFFIHLF